MRGVTAGMRWVWVLMWLTGCSLVLDADRHTGNDAGLPDVGADGARPPIPADQACAEFATVLCEARIRCCEAAAEESPEECSIDFQRQCLETLGAWVADPKAEYSELHSAQVLDALEAAASTCDGAEVMDILVRDFPEVAQGSLPAGSACDPLARPVEATYCEGPLECLNTGGALLGSWACGEPRRAGGECVTYLECQDGLGCAELTCGPLLPDGQSCRTGGDCRSGLCERDRPAAIFGQCVAPDQQRVFCGALLASTVPRSDSTP